MTVQTSGSQGAPGPSGKAKVVVLVEDDAKQRALMEMILSGEDYEVHTAADGRQGVDLARKVRPDLVLTDINMPTMTGFELCQTLRMDEQTADIPIIFVTARKTQRDFSAGFSLGVDDYVTKPYLPNELIARIRSVLDRAQQRTSDPPAVVPAGAPPAARPARVLLAGELSAASVIEVLQALGWNLITGQLEIRASTPGLIEIHKGQLVHASVRTPRRTLEGLKAWMRLAHCTEGHFELRELGPQAADAQPRRNISERPLQSLLMDAMFHREEYRKLRTAFPATGLVLRQRGSLPAANTALERQIWQLVEPGIELDALLDALDLPDVDILQAIVPMFRDKVIGGKLG